MQDFSLSILRKDKNTVYLRTGVKIKQIKKHNRIYFNITSKIDPIFNQSIK